MKILVLDGFALNPGDLSWKGIKELGTTVVYDRTEQARILNRIGDAEIVLVNKCPITRETIEACPNLKLICVTATGYNTVDVQAAKEKGILVCNVPTYATEAVTQHVFAMLFAITNRVYEHAQSVRAGDWQHGARGGLAARAGLLLPQDPAGRDCRADNGHHRRGPHRHERGQGCQGFWHEGAVLQWKQSASGMGG